MKKLILPIVLLFFSIAGFSQAANVKVVSEQGAHKLSVNGDDFFINGMNWDYFPIGTNYNYSLWKQSDDVIRAALDKEMGLLKNMGVNVVRQYTGVPPKWIQYIYEKHGIYTMLNHSFGRYGLTIDGTWEGVTEYSNPKVKELLIREVTEMAEAYKNTPGLLMYLLGNENNYGLFWQGAETEDFPDEADKIDFIGESRGRPMYKLMNDASKEMKSIDMNHPVAICNGDLLFLEIIVEECPDVDIYGTNMYRGESFGDAFERVKNEYGKPIMFTEFGADAFNVLTNEEDQHAQAYYMVENWKEIYENAAGLGKSNNSIGGFTFQFSDGWWKFGQTKNLDVHDNNASWANGGYELDFEEGMNNMNEEWFGVCAKGPTNERGLYDLYPRAAYYALQNAHSFDPYAAGASGQTVASHFGNIQLMDAVLRARGDKAALSGGETKKLSLSRMAAKFTAFNTGGTLISTPEDPIEGSDEFPNQQGFDHMQSFFVGVQANPSSNVRANVEFNILGNVAQNPIDQIFYENRGRPFDVNTDDGDVTVRDINRFQVYRASFDWEHEYFNLKGFYRTGHYHWGYEGDFFGLYPEANYGPNMDIYNGEAPFGVEVEGKKELKGLKVALGPELWWGANPAVLVKYSTHLGKFQVDGIFHEDVDQRGASESSFAVPQPKTRRATLHVGRKFGKFEVNLGGIWGGEPLIGRSFQVQRDQDVFEREINSDDTWGGKIKLTYTGGKFNWYAQGAAQGLVANGGGDWTRTFTGWRLKDSGSGNKYNFFTGFTYNIGDLQIAPNFMWQQPIEGPISTDVRTPGRPRNILTDPFVVRSNRETVAGEILFTYDPTPATWMYEWDNDRVEDAKFAFSGGFVFRHLPTTQDAAVGILADGRTLFAFPGAAPAADLWEVHARIVSKLNPDLGFIANLYGGNAQANGSDDRMIYRYGGDVRVVYKNLKLMQAVKVDDWGPYDYHRDFNQTFPLQIIGDLSLDLSKPDWLNMPSTRIGIRGTWRALDQYSPRYCPTRGLAADGSLECDQNAIGFDNGSEWEFRTYLHIDVSN